MIQILANNGHQYQTSKHQTLHFCFTMSNRKNINSTNLTVQKHCYQKIDVNVVFHLFRRILIKLNRC